MKKIYLSCSQLGLLPQCNFKKDCICEKCEYYEYYDNLEEMVFDDFYYEEYAEFIENLGGDNKW